jgi:ubiquinone/menaquinone biosynthesis C-methylase UbiE
MAPLRRPVTWDTDRYAIEIKHYELKVGGTTVTPELLKYLCDPYNGGALRLVDAEFGTNGDIVSGRLVSDSGSEYPIVRGIPRFVQSEELARSVSSFGDEWNYFNYTSFKDHWLQHTVANTFDTIDVFRDKVVVDAGGGSGAQTLWMLEAGAKHVIMLDLSNSVDDVVRRNLGASGYRNYDVIQCSIDAPPIRAGSIDGIVYCHNVIQHTPSVEKTARALYELVAPGGEFVFNVYHSNDEGLLRWIRFHLIYRSLRAVLSRLPFWAILSYARTMALIREVPLLGVALEKAGVLMQGDVPRGDGDGAYDYLRKRIRATTLNTYDWYGFHEFQHHLSDTEVQRLVFDLQPDPEKILNYDKYLAKPTPIGCALRVFR